ncbi:MAG: hypothetical protein WCD53_11380 [Microcoleus sp.]
MIDLSTLIELRDEPNWIRGEYGFPLDHWTGLLSFSNVYESMNEAYCGSIGKNDAPTHLEPRLQTDIVLQQLTDKLSIGYRLRQPPAFVVLPTNGATAIIGIVFKIDSGGHTYLCFPEKYTPLWEWWFGIQGEEIKYI